MKIRMIAAIAAAVMGLSLLSAPAFADGGHRGDRGHGYSQGHRGGHDCNDRRHKHYGQRHRGHDRFADRRGGRHDRGGWRDNDRRGNDRDGHRGRNRHRDRDWNDGRRGR